MQKSNNNNEKIKKCHHTRSILRLIHCVYNVDNDLDRMREREKKSRNLKVGE